MKPQDHQMRRVRNVHNRTLIFFIILVLMLFCGCKAIVIEKSEFVNENGYNILKNKTSDGMGCYLLFKYFDFEKNSERIPFSFVIVNDLIVKDSIIQLLPESRGFDIKISVHSKETVLINDLKLLKGDSIVINAYLRDSYTSFEK